jgi:hypothetical protein
MTDLNQFFKEERKRVVEPGPFFVRKVMARLEREAREGRLAARGVWEYVPNASRRVFALALTILFVVLAIQIMVPIEPRRGTIETYMSSGLTPSETLLFTGVEAPTSSVYIEELILEPAE